MIPAWAQLVYLVCAVCFVLALKGLSVPASARRGNLLGAIAASVAVVVPFVIKTPATGEHLRHVPLIVAAIVLGTLGGVYGAQTVRVARIPRAVTLLNGFGAIAAALVGLLALREKDSAGWFVWVLAVLAIALGVVAFAGSLVSFARRRADVPVVLSVLNALTGLSVAAGGLVLSNTVLLVGGTLVGASGLFLAVLMAKSGGAEAGGSGRPVRSLRPADAAILLGYADRVVIVPGYGLGVAQAQRPLRELVDLLGERGTRVDYAIHPVAGRMPGHMNALLGEAQVPYEQLRGIDEINGDFKDTDVVLVVGANDVVNPAARTTPGAPIYGMPVLDADEAKNILVMKRSMEPGFAGIENQLLYDDKTQLLFGDAKETMPELVNAVKAL